MIRTSIQGIGDPFVLRVGDTYYMYTTGITAARDGFAYHTSTDLENWTTHGYCYTASAWGENDFWAPEVHAVNGRYYLFYTARWKHNHSLRLGLAVADEPQGPFIDLKDGPFYDFGYAAIDATVLCDDDGKMYMYYSKDCSENVVGGKHLSEIYGVELNAVTLEPMGEPKLLATPDAAWEMHQHPVWHWNEAPAILKRNAKYYLNYSVNCFDSLEYSIGCAEAVEPLGDFVKYDDNPIMSYRENVFSGPGHNSFFESADGVLYTAFHVHTDYHVRGSDRCACIARVSFDTDGKMLIER